LTTKEIIAVFLVFWGAQSVAGSVLYWQVVGGDTLRLVFFIMGVAFIAAAIAVLKWWRE